MHSAPLCASGKLCLVTCGEGVEYAPPATASVPGRAAELAQVHGGSLLALLMPQALSSDQRSDENGIPALPTGNDADSVSNLESCFTGMLRVFDLVPWGPASPHPDTSNRFNTWGVVPGADRHLPGTKPGGVVPTQSSYSQADRQE